MSDTAKKGILVVSFGTSYEGQRRDAKKKLVLLLQIVKFIAHGPAK